MTSRMAPNVGDELNDEYAAPHDSAAGPLSWSEIASTGTMTATARSCAAIEASAADSASTSAARAHRSAMSALDAEGRASQSAASGVNSQVNQVNSWSIWFFVLGILLGVILCLAGILTTIRLLEDSRPPVSGQQPIVVTEYPLPQPFSPSDLPGLIRG
ncbi:hypothetical protein [Mycolicibacterium farcinogenes]|uniref:Uncharacterized protein n=1 Tax=Mycolicibacterium farcinogenes TaxID=1802 RepID=A0ACD1FQV5_MYCFR|nr:hypothetical protein [Mycolicibacterium farcinogenes]QZH69375.1 hypothetical protein K6L26_30710 [Mycolicibacterium farcinogenes]